MAQLPEQVPTPKKPETKKKTTTARDYGTLHQKLRGLRLKLHPFCETAGCEQVATIAHHIVRPATSIEHYRCVCQRCHIEIHNRKH